MKIVLCCGDRNWTNYRLLLKTLKKVRPDAIVEGGQASFDKKKFEEDSEDDGEYHYGADYLWGKAADELGIPHFQCNANWEFFRKLGKVKAAGPIRNGWMLKFMKVSLVLAAHNDLENSRGTKDMIRQAKKKGIKVKVISE